MPVPIYTGYWWAPEREALQVLIDHTQQRVNGWVRVKLYKGGNQWLAAIRRINCLTLTIATFEDDGGAQSG